VAPRDTPLAEDAAMTPLLQVEGIAKIYGARIRCARNVSFDLLFGARFNGHPSGESGSEESTF